MAGREWDPVRSLNWFKECKAFCESIAGAVETQARGLDLETEDDIRGPGN